jgi:hypothetical protein
MLYVLTRGRWYVSTVMFVLLATASASADTWVRATPDGSLEIEPASRVQAPQLDVLGYDAGGIQVSVDVPGVLLVPQKTVEGGFVVVSWPDAAPSGSIGGPALPVIRRLFVAPVGATVSVEPSVRTSVVMDGAALGVPLRVMPRQAPVEKIPGALENAPFDYDPAAYAVDADYPAEAATVEELGVVRGQRLFLLEVRPLAYNPVAETITFRLCVDVEIEFSGTGQVSSLTPLPGLDRIVLNPGKDGGESRGVGNYLIIAAAPFETQIAAFATHKESKGFDVTTHIVPSGTSTSTIKAYIQSLWGGADSPDYILLVGDTQHIPNWIGGGYGSPATDLPYTCMDGGDDWYPDIAIGRFPVDDAGELTAVLDKTLYYDNARFADPDYLKRAAFMASVDNYEVSEGTHNYVINTHLEPAEYTCDKLYQVTYGATSQDVRDSFNDGRFFGIFSGHGDTYYWADGPPFYQSDVTALTNENMYSLVMSFACITGTYTVDECFCETWILAPSKGAVGIWGSSVNSYWTEDDVLEKRWFDSIFDADDDVPSEFGPTFNDTRMRYLAQMGGDSTTRRYFEMYNLLGDPSLRYPGSCSDAGTVVLDRVKYACESTAEIVVSDCGLNLDDAVVETVEVTIASDSEPSGETVVLIETSPNSAEFVGAIELSGSDAGGVLLIGEGDTVTATYVDEDDGSGSQVVVTSDATVDCTPPSIWNVHVTDLEPRSATVVFDADETVRGTVQYGLSCGSLTWSASGGFGNPASVGLSGLQDATTYYFIVIAEDEAGNEVTDDNGGACYSFTTPDIPDFFTELFESGNDLDNLSLSFTPNGSVDFYEGCTESIDELPTDPAGGTTIYLSDDDYERISLTGGATVSLYGVGYSSFYVGSNGYVTFTGGDTDYTESLEDHFETPRIAALYDDLNPSSGGSVSWKQLDDRAVVTFENVPEYYSDGSNTFQIEMFFDGDIRISYLGVSITDGLAGLSEGEGFDPDYYPSDLSAMGDCQPPCPADLDGDGTIGLGDLAIMLANYPTESGATGSEGDLDGDGDIDLADLAILLSVYGTDCQ